MTTSTLLSSISQNQNQAGPAVPAPSVVDAGALVGPVTFTLTVTPTSGWAEAAVRAGPDNVAFPFCFSVVCGPQAGGTSTLLVDAVAHTNQPSNTPDGMRYFTSEMMTVSPGATATLTMTY